MMSILHVVQSLDPAWGGIARVLPELADGLAGHGVCSTIAALAGGRYGAPGPISRRTAQQTIGATADTVAVGAAGVVVRTFAAGQGGLGWSREFNRAIADLASTADVVHLHGLWTAQNRFAGRAARRLGKPYVMTPHSMMMPWAWRRSWWKKRPIGWWYEHGNLRRAACLHALSDGEAEAMRALRFNSRIDVIPNGVWPDDYAESPPADALVERFPELRDRRWLLYLSRIHPQKGIVPLMQGCFDAAALAGDWQLVIAGPDEVGLQKLLEAAVTRKGMRGRVTFTGMLSRADVLAALGRAELLVQPSLSEGLSMSILEALAAGLPVLISPACNMPEVESAGAGRVVAPERRSIAAALRELIGLSDVRRKEMSARARQLVRDRFAWPALLPRYVAMYRAAVGE